MMTMEEQKIQKLLDLLQEQNVMYQRAIKTCEELEKALRGKLNGNDFPSAA